MLRRALLIGLLFAAMGLTSLAQLAKTATAPAAASEPAKPAAYPQRWNYVNGDVSTKEGTDKLIDLLKQSKAVGCTHIQLNENWCNRLELQKPDYFENAKKVQACAKENGLTLVMGSVSIGYSGTYAHYDVNWMAGNPVKNVPYIVNGKTAKPDPAAVPALENGGFEYVDYQFESGRVAGWTARPQEKGDDWQPARLSLLDTQVKHSGTASLKGGKMVRQMVKCEPFKYYRISWYAKGAPKDGVAWNDERYHLMITSSEGKRRHTYTEPTRYPPDKDGWVRCEIPLNTYEATELDLRFGGGKESENWFDDLKFEPAGMLLLVQRPLIPLVVASQDGQTTYQQGKDFLKVEDPVCAVKPFPGEFPIDHEAPAIVLTADSRIKDGQKLLVSYYHHIRVYTDQDGISLEEPATWPIYEQVFKQIVQAWPTGHYMINYDEIRHGGWEAMPDPSIKTQGQLLAWHFKKSYDLVRKYDPKAVIYTWSDMFTPFHNAQGGKYYYYTAGNWEGSWEGFPSDVVIFQWFSPKPEGVKFFADRGNKQVICGFYDGASTPAMKKNIQGWMDVTRGAKGVEGFMYTTWNKNYKQLEEYFKLLDSFPQWGEQKTAAARKIPVILECEKCRKQRELSAEEVKAIGRDGLMAGLNCEMCGGVKTAKLTLECPVPTCRTHYLPKVGEKNICPKCGADFVVAKMQNP
jgi:hypothetical protein